MAPLEHNIFNRKEYIAQDFIKLFSYLEPMESLIKEPLNKVVLIGLSKLEQNSRRRIEYSLSKEP